MWRVIADRVLIAQLVCDLVQGSLHLGPVVFRIQNPGSTAAGFGKVLHHGDVRGIGSGWDAPSSRWSRQRKRQREWKGVSPRRRDRSSAADDRPRFGYRQSIDQHLRFSRGGGGFVQRGR